MTERNHGGLTTVGLDASEYGEAGAIALGRRNQLLAHEMRKLIGDMKHGVQNPQAPSDLERLDSLATRISRNSERLLVATPIEWHSTEHVALDDLVRAALAETGEPDRIEVGEISENVMYEGPISDVAHLLFELIENATYFSKPGSRVSLSAHETLEGVEVEVFDEGHGIDEMQLAELNERLSDPTGERSAAQPEVGLFVVGCIAQQYGIDVHLESRPDVGTVATVMLPHSMFLDGETGVVDNDQQLDAVSPALDRGRIAEIRKDVADVVASAQADRIEDLMVWDPAAIHDEHLADASVPTMDEMIEAMPAFPSVTPDSGTVTPVVQQSEPADVAAMANHLGLGTLARRDDSLQ